MLWSISPKLACFLVLYAFGGSYLTVYIFGRPIVSYNAAILRQEADFRYALLRVREHAEAIAFYRAGATERGLGAIPFTFSSRFAHVLLTVCSTFCSQSPPGCGRSSAAPPP